MGFLVIIFFILALVLGVMALAHAEVNLDIIGQIESNNKALAYNPDSQARGMFQITPICLKDYNQQTRQNLPLEALFSPSTCRSVAKWYFVARIPQLLRIKGIPVTLDNVLWAYNSGIRNVVRGIKPLETRKYIIKYHKLEREA